MFALAVRNLRRRPGRSLALALGIASLAATAFIISALFVSSHQSLMLGGMRLGGDAVVVARGEGKTYSSGNALLAGMPSREYLDASLIDTLAARDDVVDASGQLFIMSAELPCCSIGDTLLVGFDPKGDFTVRPWLREKLSAPLRQDEIIAGADLLSETGGRIVFFGSLFTIAAKLEPTGITSLDQSVFMPMEGARLMIEQSAQKAEQPLRIPSNSVSIIFVRFAAGVDPERAAIKIEYDHPDLEVVLASRTLTAARQKLSAPIWAMIGAGALQWIAVLVLSGVLFALSIGERSREAGVMRAIGARRRHLAAMFLWEVSVVSVLGGATGTAAGIFGLYLFQDFLRVVMHGALLLPPVLELSVLAMGAFTFAAAAGISASLRPVAQAAKRNIIKSITY